MEKQYEDYLVTLMHVFTGIFVMCLLFAFWYARRKKGYRPADSRPACPIKAVRLLKSRASEEKSDPETEAVLTLYPILREIPYISVPQGVAPLSLHTLDDGLKWKMVEKISSFETLQANSGRLLNLLRDPESNPGEISAIVSTNPLFSAKLLQAVNSVYFNLPRRITSVGRAITLLGYNNVRSLVLQDALRGMIPGKETGSGPHTALWVHSAMVSACSGYLGKKVFDFSEYELATMGLLHDMGKYYMDDPDPGRTHPGFPLPLREDLAFGYNHALMGSLVAENWRLPGLVSRAIAYHHHPSFLTPESLPEDCIRQSFVLCLSDLVATLLDYGSLEGEVLPIRREYFTAFGIRDNPSLLITPLLMKEVHKARSIVESYASSSLE